MNRRPLTERFPRPKTGMKMGLEFRYAETVRKPRGFFIFHMTDARTGDVLHHFERENVITLDAGILAARQMKDSQQPVANRNNGLRMLTIGTGATGNVLSPDAPTEEQRRLNSEIQRKAFASSTFRDESGVAVAYPTHIVDFTTTYGEAEAVGPLNEMGVISPYSDNPAVQNPIENGPTDYDPTIDVSAKDLMANYLTFGVVTKPSTALLTITWRFTF
jgi:hypothetical protein